MERNIRTQENYGDWLAKLYPEIKIYEDDIVSKRILNRCVTFQVTDACNLACTYCYQINKSTRRMSFETAKLAIDKLLSGEDGFADYIDPETVPSIVLEFIGGEPFLEIDLIDKITDYFKLRTIELNHPWANKYSILICSNGVLYKDPRVQRYLQKNKDVMSFNVTVDGTQELHDACRVFPDGSPSYHLAHEAALDWMARGYDMGSKITIAPGNLKYFSECLLAMVKDGYHILNANCVYEEGWTLEHATELYYQCKKFIDNFHANYDAKDYEFTFFTEKWAKPLPSTELNNWCGGIGTMLAIDPDGNMFPCIRYMESSLGNSQPPLIIGNVYTGLMRKDCEKKCVNCLNKITRRTQSTDQCFYCPIACGCAWCSGYNYQVHGTADKRTTYACEMHKARCLAVVYYYNSYYKKNNINEVKDLWVPRQWAVPIIGEEEYEKLVELTKSLGGYVNEDITMVDIGEKLLVQHRHENFKDIKVISRD